MGNENQKKHKKFSDAITYAYLRKIKKWMFCPNCQDGKMTIDKKSTIWTCSNCGYTLSVDEFEDDYVFWFCDECGTYLNVQEGFDRTAIRHTCGNCGYENDTTFDNVKGICSDCGTIIPDADSTLCDECKKARQEKAKAWLATAGKVAGVVAAVAGTIYAVSQSAGDDEDDSVDSLKLTDDGPREKKGKYKIIFDGEEQDEVFDTEEDAEEYALYLRSCTRTGAETLHWSNPGDYDYNEDTFEDQEYEIVEDD